MLQVLASPIDYACVKFMNVSLVDYIVEVAFEAVGDVVEMLVDQIHLQETKLIVHHNGGAWERLI